MILISCYSISFCCIPKVFEIGSVSSPVKVKNMIIYSDFSLKVSVFFDRYWDFPFLSTIYYWNCLKYQNCGAGNWKLFYSASFSFKIISSLCLKKLLCCLFLQVQENQLQNFTFLFHLVHLSCCCCLEPHIRFIFFKKAACWYFYFSSCMSIVLNKVKCCFRIRQASILVFVFVVLILVIVTNRSATTTDTCRLCKRSQFPSSYRSDADDTDPRHGTNAETVYAITR